MSKTDFQPTMELKYVRDINSHLIGEDVRVYLRATNDKFPWYLKQKFVCAITGEIEWRDIEMDW